MRQRVAVGEGSQGGHEAPDLLVEAGWNFPFEPPTDGGGAYGDVAMTVNPVLERLHVPGFIEDRQSGKRQGGFLAGALEGHEPLFETLIPFRAQAKERHDAVGVVALSAEFGIRSSGGFPGTL